MKRISTQPNKVKKINYWFISRYEYLAPKNKKACKKDIIDTCNEMGVRTTTHIFYNWLTQATEIKVFIANIIRPILDKWEKKDASERTMIRTLN